MTVGPCLYATLDSPAANSGPLPAVPYTWASAGTKIFRDRIELAVFWARTEPETGPVYSQKCKFLFCNNSIVCMFRCLVNEWSKDIWKSLQVCCWALHFDWCTHSVFCITGVYRVNFILVVLRLLQLPSSDGLIIIIIIIITFVKCHKVGRLQWYTCAKTCKVRAPQTI